MKNRIMLSAVSGLVLAGALLLVASLASADVSVVTKEKVIPKNGNLVPFTISTGAGGAVIHSITVDNYPTARRGLCVSDGSGPLIDADEEQCEDAGHEIVAIQIGDSFYRPGELPATMGDDAIGMRSFGEPVWDEYNMWGIEDNQQMILWFRADDSSAGEPANRVAIEVIVGATGAAVSLN